MKILDVTEFYSDRGGGVRSHLTARAHVLYQLGHEHLVVAPGGTDDESGGRENPPNVLRVKGPALPYDPSYHLLWRVDKVRRRIAREHPDVLEIHSPYVAAMSALAVPRKDFGVRTFQWHADFVDTYLRPFLQKSRYANVRLTDVVLEPLWGWVRAIGRGCDATFVAARWQQEKLAAHGVPRVFRVPFGIDKKAFRPEKRSAEVRRELLGPRGAENPDAKLLVGVGRFATEKRWDVVLRAFLKVRESAPVTLVLFGDGPERGRMEAVVAGCPDVHFMGFEKSRERLATALASADLLVHGCPYETYGLSIAEALSSGLAAVVPDEGGAAEMVEAGGGLRYRALDADHCAERIVELLAVDPGERRRSALDAAARVPTVAESVRETVNVYERLLAPPSSSVPRSAR